MRVYVHESKDQSFQGLLEILVCYFFSIGMFYKNVCSSDMLGWLYQCETPPSVERVRSAKTLESIKW